jgi:nicotinamidase/pyrazinamidase
MIDPKRDALVIVDVQNDFCPGGSLPVPEGDKVVPVLSRYARRLSEAGAAVFASRDWHPEKTAHFRMYGGAWPPHCVQGTRGAEFHPGLTLPAGTIAISKGTDPSADAYSCFQACDRDGKTFVAVLGEKGIRRLFVGGLATDYCVKATVLDAIQEGFQVVVLEDAIRAVNVNPGDGENAIAGMKAAGAAFMVFESL